MIDTKIFGSQYNPISGEYNTFDNYPKYLLDISNSLPCYPKIIYIMNFKNDTKEEFRYSKNIDENNYSYYIILLKGYINIKIGKDKYKLSDPGNILLIKEKIRKKNKIIINGEGIIIYLITN